MKPVRHSARQHLRTIQKRLGLSRVFRKFASKYDMVYFGSVHRDDEARLVRGITLSRTQVDAHYCVGSAYGRGVIFVQRSDVERSAYQKPVRHTWNILQIDLADTARLSHVFVERYDAAHSTYAEKLSAVHRDWVVTPPSLLAQYDSLFLSRYRVHSANITSALVGDYLSPLVASQIAHYFSQFSFEIVDDTLLVYFVSRYPLSDQLDHMVKAGVWLADEIEKTRQTNPFAS